MTTTTDRPVLASKPCDVEYRVRRLEVLAGKTQAALRSIDPSAVDGAAVARGLELVAELAEITRRIAGSRPPKRSYAKAGREKPVKEPGTRRAPRAPRTSPVGDLAGTGMSSLDALLEAAE